GMEPFQIGEAMEVGGKISLISVVDPDGIVDPIPAVQIDGSFKVAEIGGDITLIITQYGPVLAKVGVPVAVPIGPTGLILTGVSGGIEFGPAHFPTVNVPDGGNAEDVRATVLKDLFHDQNIFD